MADGIELNVGSGGSTIDSDEIAGKHYPRSKLIHGANGTNDGDVSKANPLPVGTNTVKDGSGTLQAFLADSDGHLQIDIVGALPAGSAAIGKLAANSGIDIGDVDVLSIAAGDNNIGNVDIVTVPADPFGANADAASATGSISAKLRFIASTGIPITGTVTVGSHAVTNAGTFVVQVDGTALTRLTDIETNTDSGAVVGNGAAATAQRVTLANDSTGVLGTVTTVTTVSTLTTITNAVKSVGNTAHDAALSDAPVAIGGFAKAAAPTAVSTDGDAVRAWFTLNGAQYVALADASGQQVGVSGSGELKVGGDFLILDDAAYTPAGNSVIMGGYFADETATNSVSEGDAGAARMTLDRKQIVTDYTHTAGGESSLSALSTAAVYTAEVKGLAGQVYSLDIFNKGAAAVYVRLYNQTGAPGTGDAANIIWRGIVPGSTTGAGFIRTWPKGKACATGIGVRVSGAIADNDATALAANEVTINVGYK